MIHEEAEGRWDKSDERGHTKWGTLTRTERFALAGRRHSLELKLQELYGSRTQEPERATTAPGKSRP